MVKIDLITGFLGAGKTTFLQKYARYLMRQGKRIGILEYDFGGINVDMLLLNKLRCDKCEVEMVAAGCDEDCLRRRFRTKLISMAMSGYDRVIVEPSGVFDMDQFFDPLRDAPLEDWYEIGSVITVVDATSPARLSEEEEYFIASQAAGAGTVLLSRAQECDATQLENVKQHVIHAAEGIGCKDFSPNFLAKDWEELTDDDFKRLSDSGYHIRSYVKKMGTKGVSFSSVCYINVQDDLDTVKEKIATLFSDESFGKVLRIKAIIRDSVGSVELNATPYAMKVAPIGIGQETLIIIGSNLNEGKIKELIGAEY